MVDHQLLEKLYQRYANIEALSEGPGDPLLVARQWADQPYGDEAALLCALFAYGNVRAILGLLKEIDFSLLERPGEVRLYYRFQTKSDLCAILEALRRVREEEGGVAPLFKRGYEHYRSVWGAIEEAAQAIMVRLKVMTPGLTQLMGGGHQALSGKSPLKRWNLLLRWMVRTKEPDMGRWSFIPTSALIVPLDLHLARVGRELGLLTRKSNDKKAAIELTSALARFDCDDPVRYDFALYRYGQLGGEW